MLLRPRVWPGRTQGFGLPELAISWCLAVPHPAPTHSRGGFALVLAVSKLLFRPRVWPGRTQVFGLPELAISWCLAVSHPAPTDAFSRLKFHSRGGFALVLLWWPAKCFGMSPSAHKHKINESIKQLFRPCADATL